MIGRRRKFVFIHVPKAAGQSVSKALRPHALYLHQRVLQRAARAIRRTPKIDLYALRNGHMTALEYRAELGEAAYAEHFRFAFVRNPWDRMLSLCSFIKLRPNSEDFSMVKNASFDDFLVRVRERGLKQQSDYVLDQKGELIVDFVGRFETLRDSFGRAMARLGIEQELPHKNKSRHGTYRDAYSDFGRGLVASHFATDIAPSEVVAVVASITLLNSARSPGDQSSPLSRKEP